MFFSVIKANHICNLLLMESRLLPSHRLLITFQRDDFQANEKDKGFWTDKGLGEDFYLWSTKKEFTIQSFLK